MKKQAINVLWMLRLVLFATILWIASGKSIAQEESSLINEIDRLAAFGEKAESDLVESVANQIEEDPCAISPLLLARLSDPNITESQKAIYVWSLGLARDTKSIDTIIAIAENTTSELVKGNCLNALSFIGGEKAGAFLMASLDKTDDAEMQFNILNLLAQMQYEPALKKTEIVLKQDFQKYYWQSAFIFGKMGDKAIPFLLKKISDKNKDTRAHAISALGQWLIAPESAEPMQKQYWKEKDTDIRGLILGSLERVIGDLDGIEKFSAKVAAKEKDVETLRFAKETLANIEHMKKEVRSFQDDKEVSTAQFQKEYDLLYRSCGKKGDYKVLGKSSCLADEAKLKKLRERILQRNSDESFYDYQEVNNIIMLNRLTGK